MLDTFHRKISRIRSQNKLYLCNWQENTKSTNFSVFQLTPVGTTIFQGLRANDLDAGVNGLVEYSIVRGDGKRLGTDQGVGRDRVNVADGAEFFAINLPHQGQVTVNRSLDFERTQRYLVTVVATVSTSSRSLHILLTIISIIG